MAFRPLNLSRPAGALGALAAVTALLAGCASKPPAPPTISPVVSAPVQLAWQQGRTPEQARSTLAPLAGKLTVTPPEQIPLNRLQVPAGFKLELWAHGLPG
ncbi:MAG: sorbosone dehydrogenase family protein, partial [Rubrivivax sp.]